MRRFLSLALLALTTPMIAFAQASAVQADHGTPQTGQKPNATAQANAKPAKPAKKPAVKPAAADATDTHGTPQGQTLQK